MTRPSRPVLLVIAAALIAQAEVAAAAPLGRLFFTPERRAALERQRQLNIQEARTVQGATVRLDGIVRRSSGRTTVWVNGVPQDERSNSAGVSVRLPRREADKAILGTGEEPPAELRVGETINRGTRETTDVIQGGRIAPRTSRSEH